MFNYRKYRLFFEAMTFFLLLFTTISPINADNSRIFQAHGRYGAVSTGHPLASKAAVKILENGGNAVDAAVCAAFMLGVVDFTNSGPGGDGFALVHLPSGAIVAFDASSRKPLDFSRNRSDIGIPTEPELLLKLQKLFGKFSIEKVIQPAIDTCINGFYTSSYLNKVISKKLPKLTDPAAIKFLAPNGFALPAGSLLKQPVLAQTLRQLSRDHGKSFYSGETAKLIIQQINELGSSYSQKDLARYRSQISLPFKAEWKNYALYGTPPPSSSVASIKLAIDFLNEQIDLFSESALDVIRIAKIGRKLIDFKYNHLSRFVQNPDDFFNEADLSRQRLQTFENDAQTTHLCVWDKNNLAVSMTLTLGSHCGTGNLSKAGFFYNNEMRNFKPLVALYPDDYPADKGPVSSKSPLMIKKNGQLFTILGGAGSDRIIFNTALVAARMIKDNSSIFAAVNSPRFFLDYKNVLHFEWSANRKFSKTLPDLWPAFRQRESGDDYFGLVTCITRNEDVFHAVADFRRDADCRTAHSPPQNKEH
jgi:gamma-glutamyltranspeptidase